jgi:hypothetical protein
MLREAGSFVPMSGDGKSYQSCVIGVSFSSVAGHGATLITLYIGQRWQDIRVSTLVGDMRRGSGWNVRQLEERLLDPVVLSCVYQVEELHAESTPRKFTCLYREVPTLAWTANGRKTSSAVDAGMARNRLGREDHGDAVGVAAKTENSCSPGRSGRPPPPNTRRFSENILKVVLASPKIRGLRRSRRCGGDWE